jgi:phospholipid-translocating ATPase
MPENVIPVSDLSEGPESSKISADGTAVHDGSHSPSSSDRPLKHDDAHSKGTDGDAHADGSNKPKVKLAKDVLVPFHDDEITRDLADQNSEQSQAIHGFFATLALCHTALASEDENGVIQYMAQSPDESALCVFFIFLISSLPLSERH